MTDLQYLLDHLQSGTRFPSLRRRHKRKSRSPLKRWTWDAHEFNVPYMMKQHDNNIFIGATDIHDYIVSSISVQRQKSGQAMHHEYVTLAASMSEWRNYINRHSSVNSKTSSNFKPYWTSKDNGIVINEDTNTFFSFVVTSSSVEVSFYGDSHLIESWLTDMLNQFEEIKNVIEWVYSSQGQSVQVPLRNDRVPFDEMYPWLNGESLTDYYDRFMDSGATILLLLGPPGTGKTTFIRGFLQHTRTSAIATYDASILSKDHVFAEFVEGDRNVMVVEDADAFLAAREDGNDMMHKFLNVGDGLVTTRNKKMIFSTNLSSVTKIDQALIRPGRCFDIVTFAPLSKADAEKAAAKLNITLSDKRKEWTIAELFFQQAQKEVPTRSIGFL